MDPGPASAQAQARTPGLTGAGLTGAPGAGPRGWLGSLQSLRGLAALAVVLYHVDVDFRNHELPLLGVPGMRFGWLGVDLFFVLSAYLLGRPFLAGRSRPVREFWVDRFLRIAPAYYVAAAATIVFLVLLYPGVWDVPWSLWSLVFLNNMSERAIAALNPVFWTLAVEVQFYAILPWLARRFAGPRWVWWTVGCIATAVVFRWATWTFLGAWGEDLGSFALPSFLGHFALGLAAARLRKVPAPAAAALAGLGLVILPAVLLVPPDSLTFGYASLAGQMWLRPVAAVGFAFLVLASASPGRLRLALEWAPLRWLGDRSYSIYLLHILAILAIDLTFGLEDRVAFTVLSVLASIACGALLHALIEAPAERWRHRRKLRSQTGADSRATPGV